MIQPIVEGHGEMEAVPVLLRRLLSQAQAFEIRIGVPIRRPRGHLVRRETLGPSVDLARRQSGCSSILILFDGDEDCPSELAPEVQSWAEAASGVPCAVVMAHREYEAWFLAGIESLRGLRGIRDDAVPPTDPEGPRGAKEALEALMKHESSYHETADQPSLTARMDLARVYRRGRSFRRMTSAFGQLLRAEGVRVRAWPPKGWKT